MQTLLIIAIITGILTGLGLLIVIYIILDITRTSDKALEEHYKRNKK
jgi:phage shock protein PspC (stress-responsive transcriptional regulator)